MKLAILITCHNRKEKTLNCLRAISSQEFVKNLEIKIFLTDDLSTDGTSEAIKMEFPDVILLQGSGSLFWNRGMHHSWQHASVDYDYDFYLWLNDDTQLFHDSLKRLIETSELFKHQANIVGTSTSFNDSNKFTYGGRDKKNNLIIPSDEPQLCSFFHGNIVLIPKYVFKKVGYNDYFFRHALGDYDYGLRSAKKNILSFVAPGIFGNCDDHANLPVWCNPHFNLKKRVKVFRTPLGHNPEEFFYFDIKHNGILSAVLHYFTAHFWLFFPSLKRKK